MSFGSILQSFVLVDGMHCDVERGTLFGLVVVGMVSSGGMIKWSVCTHRIFKCSLSKFFSPQARPVFNLF